MRESVGGGCEAVLIDLDRLRKDPSAASGPQRHFLPPDDVRTHSRTHSQNRPTPGRQPDRKRKTRDCSCVWMCVCVCVCVCAGSALDMSRDVWCATRSLLQRCKEIRVHWRIVEIIELAHADAVRRPRDATTGVRTHTPTLPHTHCRPSLSHCLVVSVNAWID